MKNVTLGRTGITVTELCFGALPIGPMQKNVDVDDASDTIAHALLSGIDFVDTAKMYRTYEHIRLAMEKSGKRPTIASKSTSEDYEGMERDVLEAIEALGVPHLDIFYLHAARSGADVFSQRSGALAALLDCKAKGLIKAVGISTHNVKATELAAKTPEIDVVFPIINLIGKGILEGTVQEMIDAIESCYAAEKGVVLMKALAGGVLINDFVKAMDYVTALSKGRAAIAVGMVNKPEVDMNLKYFSGVDITACANEIKAPSKKFLIVSAICKNCGACAKACHSDAVSLKDGKMTIDSSKCLTCGYCVEACGEFAIRMI